MDGDMLRIHIEITVILFFVKRNEKADEKLLQAFDPLLFPSVSPSSSSSIQTNEKGIKGEMFCFRINITCRKWEGDYYFFFRLVNNDGRKTKEKIYRVLH